VGGRRMGERMTTFLLRHMGNFRAPPSLPRVRLRPERFARRIAQQGDVTVIKLWPRASFWFCSPRAGAKFPQRALALQAGCVWCFERSLLRLHACDTCSSTAVWHSRLQR
jgi:hypothetical protein